MHTYTHRQGTGLGRAEQRRRSARKSKRVIDVMYIVITYSRVWINKVTLPILILLILHTQAETGAYSRSFYRFPGRRPYIYTVNRYRVSTEFIGSVLSLSGHAIACRWRSLPRVRRHGASSPRRSFSNECCLFRYHHGPINVRLSF